MKKVWWLIVFFVLISFVCADNNIYRYDSLDLELSVEGKINLVATGSNADVSRVGVELLLYPENNFRQKLVNLESEGELNDGKVVFEWLNLELGEKEYGFTALVQTENKRIGVDKKIEFPITISNFEEYLEETEHVDINNPKIIAQATSLVEGEDDLFEAVFKLAKWVEENIEYDLNTLTTDVSQKAGWVLENKQGVCDEMTSLFIAMCRSLGIPAKFVSGISYTENDEVVSLVGKNWAGHGWAEVYFPGKGWVAFDIAFGEYGYVDVTHIKLKEGTDSGETSTKFEWLANNVDLETENLIFSVDVKNKGKITEEEITLNLDFLGEKVDFGSYNLITGVVENQKEYYTATTLKLAVPKELMIVGENKHITLLKPLEKKEVFWVVKVPEDLKKNYQYSFPILVYSEKNTTAKKEFFSLANGVHYNRQEIEELIPLEENKNSHQKVSLTCDYKKEIKIGRTNTISCNIKNIGNINLKNINFCIDEFCKTTELLINQEKKLSTDIETNEVGWKKILIKVENQEIEKKIFLEYAVLDEPSVEIKIESPKEIIYGNDFMIFVKINKNSFSNPEDTKLVLSGPNFEKRWAIGDLTKEQNFEMGLNSGGLNSLSDFEIKTTWKNNRGKLYINKEVIEIKVTAKDFKDRVVMFFNRIVNLFV